MAVSLGRDSPRSGVGDRRYDLLELMTEATTSG